MAGSGLQPALIVILFLFPSVSGLVVATRLWRKRIDRALGGDDWAIAVAWCLAMANSVATYCYVKANYIGYHDKDVPKAKIDTVYVNKLQYAIALEYNPVMCVIKLSFIWSLQRLRSPRVWIRRSLWAIQVINGLYCIVAFIMGAMPCLPLKKKFYPKTPGSCYSPQNFVIGTVVVVLATDVMVLIMPSLMIYDLHMPRIRKIVTICFLSLGYIVTAIGILRLVWLVNKFSGKTSNHSVQQGYSAIECNLAIIASSGPTIKWILGRCIPSFRAGANSSKKASNYANGSSGDAAFSRNTHRRPRFNNEYGDLETMQGHENDIELKSDWRWMNKTKVGSDSDSDERRINDGDDGIVKTVDWTVSSSETHAVPTKDGQSDTRIAVRPTDVV